MEAERKSPGIPGNCILEFVFRNNLGEHDIEYRAGKRANDSGSKNNQVNANRR